MTMSTMPYKVAPCSKKKTKKPSLNNQHCAYILTRKTTLLRISLNFNFPSICNHYARADLVHLLLSDPRRPDANVAFVYMQCNTHAETSTDTRTHSHDTQLNIYKSVHILNISVNDIVADENII